MAFRREVGAQVIATADSVIGRIERIQVGPGFGKTIGDLECVHVADAG